MGWKKRKTGTERQKGKAFRSPDNRGRTYIEPEMIVWKVETKVRADRILDDEKRRKRKVSEEEKLQELHKLFKWATGSHPTRRAFAITELKRKYPKEYAEFKKMGKEAAEQYKKTILSRIMGQIF